MGKSRTSKYYEDNPEAAEKRRKYQRKLNKTKKQKDYRVDRDWETIRLVSFSCRHIRRVD